MNIAVIMAAGAGIRVGGGIPKQFLTIAGRTVIERAVDAFETHPLIDRIAIVVARAYIPNVENMILKNNWKKICRILPGGEERFHSSLAAIEAFKNSPDDNLIFHDAARPLVDHRIISDVAMALKSHKAVGVAVPAADTLFLTDGERKFVSEVPPRALVMHAQTPQAFRVSVIQEAYHNALADSHFSGTDDCGTVVRYLPEEKVFLVFGDEKNRKLTYPEDLTLFEKWLGS